MICSYLSSRELARLTAASRNCYVGTQQALYHTISVPSSGSLAKLVRSLMRFPIVSRLSAKQQARWQKLDDNELHEREIRFLTVTLSGVGKKDNTNIYLVGQMLGALARKCPLIHVRLQIVHVWPSLPEELRRSPIPQVQELVAFLGPDVPPTCDAHFWTLFLGGEALPGLRTLDLNTIPASRGHVAVTPLDRMLKASSLASDKYLYREHRTNSIPLGGLRRLRSIRIANDVKLTAANLGVIFASPECLAHLEIENCANIGQIPALRSLSTLLQRTLPTLKHLKLHLIGKPDYIDDEKWRNEYTRLLAEHPAAHLCTMIRTLGQKIPSLDLALPFACNRIFLPFNRDSAGCVYAGDATQTPVAREPLQTLQARLLARDIKYRRLICWQGVCMEQHEWDDMASHALHQASDMSWELISDPLNQGSWHVGGCDMAAFTADSVLMRRD